MKRYKANLSHYRIFDASLGFLYPCGVVEVLPGDSFQHSTSAMLRCTPMLAPVMHSVNVRVHHFFVPNRLTMPDWEDFITRKNESLTIPQITYDPKADFAGNILNYMGIPQFDAAYGATRSINALPIRAYNLIYNEFYRDQDLVTEVPSENLLLHRVAWNKDYFTASRPWPQKGGDVTIPLTGNAIVRGYDPAPAGVVGYANTPFMDEGGAGVLLSTAGTSSSLPVNASRQSGNLNGPFHLAPDRQVGVADLTAVNPIDVRDLRLAFALQRYQEARARYGSRYTEYLAYLGVRSSDSRLQRPEYLGGGKANISFSEVLQTAEGSDPVATLRGHGIAGVRSNRYRRFFEEHGYVISLLSVVPRNIYIDSTPRHWLKLNALDYFQRELQDIGQQEVLKGELWPDGATDRQVFGYSNRYSEYLSQPSQVTGHFAKPSLDYWHFGRKFPSQPVLNQSFIECNIPLRNFADQTARPLHLFVHHQLGARRLVRRSNVGRII